MGHYEHFAEKKNVPFSRLEVGNGKTLSGHTIRTVTVLATPATSRALPSRPGAWCRRRRAPCSPRGARRPSGPRPWLHVGMPRTADTTSVDESSVCSFCTCDLCRVSHIRCMGLWSRFCGRRHSFDNVLLLCIPTTTTLFHTRCSLTHARVCA